MYNILFQRSAAKEYDKLESRIQDRIDEKILLLKKGEFHILDIDKYEGKIHTYRMRVGDYRVIYEKIDNTLIITVIKIGHRKDVYK